MVSNSQQNQKEHLKLSIVFWIIVIFSLGFYLIYYYQIKKHVFKMKKNIEIKLLYLKNICLTIVQEINLKNLNLNWNDINQNNSFKQVNFDFSQVLTEIAEYSKKHTFSISNDGVANLLIRLCNLQKSVNHMIQHFNIDSFKLTYRFVFMNNQLAKFSLIEPFIDVKEIKMKHDT